MLEKEDGEIVLKHKGPAKDLITADWFKRLYADPSITKQISTEANFRIDWKKRLIGKKKMNIKDGLPLSTKRDKVYDANEDWVGTCPRNVVDLGSQDANTIIKYEILTQKGKSRSTSGEKTSTGKRK